MSLRRPRARSPHDVLERGPWLVEVPRPPRSLVSVIDQLDELVSLLQRGLLSPEEFERQKRLVLDRPVER